MTKVLNLADVEFIAFKLAKEHLSFDEPIPDFATRFPNILESCLLAPFQTFAKKPLYRGLIEKAAALFYFMIKNHPFQNGNKRIATTTMLCFLYRNGKWLDVDTHALYKFAVWVAESPPRSKDAAVQAIVDFLKDHLVGLEHT